MQILRLRFVILACALFVFALPQQTTEAATINVGCNANPATRVTELINAFNSANSTVANDTIILTASCTYTLTAVNHAADGNNGLPSIVSTATGGTLTIDGNNAIITRGAGAPHMRLMRVASDGNLRLNDVILSSGWATAVGGGALYNNGGTVRINSSAIQFNNSDDDGGGIRNAGTMTISDSNLENNDVTGDGGGVYNAGGTLDIVGGNVLLNIATGNGGGIASSDGMVTLDLVVVRDNHALSAGGVHHDDGNLIITDSTIRDNDAANGGGLGIVSGTATVTSTLFEGNMSTSTSGGGIRASQSSDLTINSSTFDDNSTNTEGGAIATFGGDATIQYTTFSGNSADVSGGGIYSNGSKVTVNYSLFTGNSANDGAAIINNFDDFSVTSSTFTDNNASDDGGAAYNVSGIMTLNFNTLVGNTAVDDGGGIFREGGFVSLANSIVANNTAPTGSQVAGVITSNGYNAISNTSGGSGFAGTDLLNAAASPLNLGALADNGGETRTMAISAGSVAINAANPSFSPPPLYDQRGQTFPRVRDGWADIGAYERLICPAFPAAIPNGDIPRLIAAIDCANANPANQVINLATNGTYALTAVHNEDFMFSSEVNGLPIIATSTEGGTLTINGNGATISRVGGAPGFRFLYLHVDAEVTLNDLNFLNGSSVAPGGAIYSAYGTLTINNCTFESNHSSSNGGAVASIEGELIVTGSTFVDNTADLGGGIYNTSDNAAITSSTFSDNSAANGGGVMLLSAANATVYDSTFDGNHAEVGGAIQQAGGTMTLRNSTFYGNSADMDGGAIIASGGVTINHTTIAGNSAVIAGGGLYHSTVGGNTINLKHTLIGGNTAPDGADVFGTITSQGYNLISDTSDMTGNVGTDVLNEDAVPLNLGALADNGGATETMALLADSAAINAGEPGAFTVLYDQRGAGFPRVNNGRLDIGAFESLAASLTVNLTLQGRVAPPSSQWSTTVHVQVRPADAGDDTLLYSFDFESNTFGLVNIPNLTTGSYRIWIKGTHTLARESIITLNSGSNGLTTATLLEGDANDNNAVNISDFSILATAFGTVFGGAGYDARADFNHDRAITISDFSLLASNYNQVGDS